MDNKRVGPSLSRCCSDSVVGGGCARCGRQQDSEKHVKAEAGAEESAEQRMQARLMKAEAEGNARSPLSVGPSDPAPPNNPVTGSWSPEDDSFLWANRTNPTESLIKKLRRPAGSVRARLAHLNDPGHSAYRRLHGGGPSASSKSGGIAVALRKAAKPAQAPAELNALQARALELAQQGHSVFLTGGAGTGKSYTLGHLVKALQRRCGERAVFVTASTGIAACHVGGVRREIQTPGRPP